jgi:hypothetical protein
MAMTDDGMAIVWATVITPIAAIAISIWYQERKQKREAKQNLFFQAMTHRKKFPPTVEWANALNLIDVIFQGCPKVISAWHSLYEYVHIRPMDMKLFEQKNLDLLSEMAKDLGYDDLKTTDIDKFYSPEAHGTQAQLNFDTQTEFLRVLKSSKSFSTDKTPE